MYRDFAVNEAAIPVIAGRKSRMESFAGADETLTIEGMMGDRKALQVSCTLSTNVCLAWQWHWWALHAGLGPDHGGLQCTACPVCLKN